MLEINDIHSGYGDALILRGVSISVQAGEIHCLFGRNGAGKTTIMKSIMGLVPLRSGEVSVDGNKVSGLPAHKVPRSGVGYVPQGRRLFPELTVSENIDAGLLIRDGDEKIREYVMDVFPKLKDRLNQLAGTLSGGEQQMLATARALCIEPKVLLLDEPTEGLQPSMIEQIRNVVIRMRKEGKAVVLVEQRVEAVLSIADKVTFIENGISRETVMASQLKDDPALLQKYVGV